MLFIMRGAFNKYGGTEFFYISEHHSIIINRRSVLIDEGYGKNRL